MSSSHDHSHGTGKTLLFALIFTTGFALVEVVGGVLAGSLALLSDAGHMFTDSLSLGVGAFAAWLAHKPASRKHSFGLQRAEVLGALFNVLFMFAVIAFIGFAAMRRLADPPAVAGGLVVLIGSAGLAVNVAVAWVLMRGEQTMNVRGALLHVMGDLLGSVAAIVAGAVIYFGGPLIVDPLLSLFVGLLILLSAAGLLREVLRVLMEGVPRDVDIAEVSAAMAQVEGVRTVHDMHVWSLSSSNNALAAHVDLDVMSHWQKVLPELQAMLRERFNITHTTLQPEDAVIRAACEARHDCGVAGGHPIPSPGSM